MRLRMLLVAAAIAGAAAPAAAGSIEAFSAALDTQWDYARPAASETRFRAELARWPEGDPQALLVATQIALARGDAAGARDWARKAYAHLKDDPDLRADEPARIARLGQLAAEAKAP